MSIKSNTTPSSVLSLGGLILEVLQSPWMEVIAEAWTLSRKLWRGWTSEGLYEVLEHHSTVELLDKRGERAVVRKRQKVRYLQNNIIAYQDQAWGDGRILINYRCTPGVPTDRYRPGNKTYILISLRDVKNKGDIDEFQMQWESRKGFLRPTELWAAEVSHRTRRLKLEVIFPVVRPPIRCSLLLGSTRKLSPLSTDALKQLPDGRYSATWETDKPKLYETYAIQWEW